MVSIKTSLGVRPSVRSFVSSPRLNSIIRRGCSAVLVADAAVMRSEARRSASLSIYHSCSVSLLRHLVVVDYLSCSACLRTCHAAVLAITGSDALRRGYLYTRHPLILSWLAIVKSFTPTYILLIQNDIKFCVYCNYILSCNLRTSFPDITVVWRYTPMWSLLCDAGSTHAVSYVILESSRSLIILWPEHLWISFDC